MATKVTNPTPMIKPEEVAQRWYVVDATDQTVGRLAGRIAWILQGKHKPQYTPHWDMGDFVVVVNAERVHLSGRKWQQKMYRHHTGYLGNLKSVPAAEMRRRHPERILEYAIKRMLPKNRLGRRQLKKLKIYAGPDHPHQAQQPEPMSVE